MRMDCLLLNERTDGDCSESEGVMGAREKDDRRVHRTQKLLRTALVSLIEEKGFEALTVQDIIDRANVGRATRMAWAVLAKNEPYRPPMLAGAATECLACR
jgi:hypothetical protein